MMPVANNASTAPQKSLRNYTLLTVFLTIFLDLVGFGMFIPILPSVARQLNASNAEAAYLSTFFSIGTLFSVMVLGRISDKIGRKKVLALTIMLSLYAQLATGFALIFKSYAALALIRLIAGIAAGNISVAQAAIADITPLRERSRSMVVIGIAFGAGFAFGPALGAAITFLFPDHSLLPIACVAAALNLINFLLLAIKFKETHPRCAPPELAPLIEEAQRGASKAGTQMSATLETRALLKRPFIKTVMLMQFIQIFGFVGVETVLPLALADAYSMKQNSIYSAFLFLGCAVLLVNGALSRLLLKRWGDCKTLSLGQVFLTIGIFLIPWVAPHIVSLYVALICLAFGSAFSNPALGGLVSRLSPQDRQGMAMGLAQTLSASARILGPAFMGLLYEILKGANSLYISSALLLTVTLIGMAGLKGLPPPETRSNLAGDEL